MKIDKFELDDVLTQCHVSKAYYDLALGTLGWFPECSTCTLLNHFSSGVKYQLIVPKMVITPKITQACRITDD
jgi:hypothetical protein